MWTDVVTLEVDFGFGSGPLATSPTFTDLVDDTRAITITRGRPSVRRQFPPGGGTVVLDNRAGEYDPNNSNASNYGDLTLGTPVRIRAVHDSNTYPMLYGHVAKWPLVFTEPSESTVPIEVAENLVLAHKAGLAEESLAANGTGARINYLLQTLLGWPSGALDLNGGVATVAEEAAYSGSIGQALDRAIEAEQGFAFVADDGTYTFRDRTHFSSASASATFGGAGHPYANPKFAYDDDLLINNAIVTGAAGGPQTSTDSTSVTTFGEGPQQVGTINNSAIATANAALNVAEVLTDRHADIRVRIVEFQVFPDTDEANLFPVVLALELGDVLDVEYSPPSGDDLDQTVKVESIRHEILPGSWVTTIGCYPLSTAELNDYWILGTSELGTDTRLA